MLGTWLQAIFRGIQRVFGAVVHHEYIGPRPRRYVAVRPVHGVAIEEHHRPRRFSIGLYTALLALQFQPKRIGHAIFPIGTESFTERFSPYVYTSVEA